MTDSPDTQSSVSPLLTLLPVKPFCEHFLPLSLSTQQVCVSSCRSKGFSLKNLSMINFCGKLARSALWPDPIPTMTAPHFPQGTETIDISCLKTFCISFGIMSFHCKLGTFEKRWQMKVIGFVQLFSDRFHHAVSSSNNLSGGKPQL